MNEPEMQFDGGMSEEELEEFIMNIPQILKELQKCVLKEKSD